MIKVLVNIELIEILRRDFLSKMMAAIKIHIIWSKKACRMCTFWRKTVQPKEPVCITKQINKVIWLRNDEWYTILANYIIIFSVVLE